MSTNQVPNGDQQAAAHKDAIAALSEHLTTTSISSAPEQNQDEKALIVRITKVQLDDAIESARRARQVDTNDQHICNPDCPLRGALGHGGVEPAPNNHQDEKALIVKLTKVELNDAIESARLALQVDDDGNHICNPDCPLRGAGGHGGGETST